MILSRLLKSLFFRKKTTPSLPATQEPRQPFFRHKGIPSVLVMTHSYHGNGAAVMLVFLLKWLINIRGWQVQALSTGLSPGDKEVLENIGVGLVDAVNPEQYDFAICNTVVSGLTYLDQYAHHLPCILWVHEGEFVIWNSRIQLGDCKRLFSACRQVVFQTQWQAERIFGSFTSGFAEHQYVVIPNCLPDLVNADEVKSEKRLADKRIVFVGGVYDRKRPLDLIKAVIKLGRNDIECIFVGTTDHMPQEMQVVLKTDNRFRVTGEVSRKVATAILASADVLSLPSGDESQPLVLLEAAQLNIPIIISDLPVYRSIWKHGENCLIHPVGDVERLAIHLETCLTGKAPMPKIPSDKDFNQSEFLDNFGKTLRNSLPESLKAYEK
jgi:glycosyltransferase involved in cell wall biosynthesis